MHHLASLFLKVSLQFPIVSNTVRMHPLASLFSKVSLYFQIVSNAVRMHHLLSLFSKVSLPFQIVSNTVRMHAPSCSWLVSEVPNYCILNSVRMFHFTSMFSKLPGGPDPLLHTPALTENPGTVPAYVYFFIFLSKTSNKVSASSLCCNY